MKKVLDYLNFVQTQPKNEGSSWLLDFEILDCLLNNDGPLSLEEIEKCVGSKDLKTKIDELTENGFLNFEDGTYLPTKKGFDSIKERIPKKIF